MKLLWLTLLLPACGYVPDFGKIHQAADEWRVATSGRCAPVIGENATIVETSQWYCKRNVGRGCLGWHAKGTIGIALDVIRSDAVLHHVALHEFGHWCGLKDDPDPASVMYPLGTFVQRVTPKDVETFLATDARTRIERAIGSSLRPPEPGLTGR